MSAEEERSELEVTGDQLQILRGLGVRDDEMQGMSMADADDLIDELRSAREAERQRGNV